MRATSLGLRTELCVQSYLHRSVERVAFGGDWRGIQKLKNILTCTTYAYTVRVGINNQFARKLVSYYKVLRPSVSVHNCCVLTPRDEGPCMSYSESEYRGTKTNRIFITIVRSKCNLHCARTHFLKVFLILWRRGSWRLFVFLSDKSVFCQTGEQRVSASVDLSNCNLSTEGVDNQQRTVWSRFFYGARDFVVIFKRKRGPSID